MNLSFLGEFDRRYGYYRVSSKEQADKRLTVEGQINRLNGVVPRLDKIYGDVQPGDESDRPDYQELVAQVQKEAIEGLRVLVVITDQSRLSREGSDRVTQLIELFDDLGITLYALDGGKQTVAEPHEWLATSQQAMFNAYYLRKMRQTLRSANAQRRVETKPVHAHPPIGYRWTKDKYVVDEDKRQIARDMINWYLPPPQGLGLSLSKCCDRLLEVHGISCTPSTLRSRLLNPTYRGHLVYLERGLNRKEQKAGIRQKDKPLIWNYNSHEALMTEGEYNLIRDRLDDNRINARRGSNKPRYPLSGLVFCGYCNCRMNRDGALSPQGKKYRNYRCKTISCRGQSISTTKLEAALIAAIARRSDEVASMAIDALDEDIPDPEVLKLEQQIRELQEVYEKTPLAGIKAAIAELEGRLNVVQSGNVKEQGRSPEDLLKLTEAISQPSAWGLLSDAEKRLVYRDLCRRIVVRRGEIQIELGF